MPSAGFWIQHWEGGGAPEGMGVSWSIIACSAWLMAGWEVDDAIEQVEGYMNFYLQGQGDDHILVPALERG